MMSQRWSISSDDPDPTVMIQIEWGSRSSDDPDRAMIQIQFWCLQDDPDRVMIQIQQWWSKSSDDPDPVMMSSDDPDLVMMYSDDPDPKMKMTWRWRWLEDADDGMIQRRRPVLTNCVERIPSSLRGSVDVFVTSECIHPYILCIVPRCLFRDVSVMYLSQFMPWCSYQEIQ